MKENKLYKYILISLLIHALILFAFPLANRAGIGDENESQDFGFIELVEYKTITQTSQEAGENQKAEKENAEEKSENIEQEKNIDKEEEPEIEIDEEIETSEEPEKIVEEANNEVTEDESSNVENQSDDTNSQEVETESENTEESTEKKDIASKNDDSEVISSDESDVEMEVEEKSESEKESKKEEQKEEDSEIDSEDESNKQETTSEEEKKEEEPPPPPPTSGELIARSITPQYPKDLIGENKKGTVEFMVNVDKTGEITNLTITNSSEIEKIDKTSRLAIERGWEFKSYNMAYSIPIVVDFKINDAGNPVIDVNLGEVDFKEVND